MIDDAARPKSRKPVSSMVAPSRIDASWYVRTPYSTVAQPQYCSGFVRSTTLGETLARPNCRTTAVPQARTVEKIDVATERASSGSVMVCIVSV